MQDLSHLLEQERYLMESYLFSFIVYDKMLDLKTQALTVGFALADIVLNIVFYAHDLFLPFKNLSYVFLCFLDIQMPISWISITMMMRRVTVVQSTSF